MEIFEAENAEKIIPPTFPEIAEEILTMAEKDQALREQIGPDNEMSEAQKIEWAILHDEQTEKMRVLIRKIGWPTVSKIGKEASEAAWLIIQHADHDVEFQKECLALMEKESESEVSPVDVAFLHDRISVNEGRPQFFGTQMMKNEYDEYGPYPIENIEQVDERRAQLGLGTLAEYKDEHAKKYAKGSETDPEDWDD
jgi:hypothetical protein